MRRRFGRASSTRPRSASAPSRGAARESENAPARLLREATSRTVAPAPRERIPAQLLAGTVELDDAPCRSRTRRRTPAERARQRVFGSVQRLQHRCVLQAQAETGGAPAIAHKKSSTPQNVAFRDQPFLRRLLVRSCWASRRRRLEVNGCTRSCRRSSYPGTRPPGPNHSTDGACVPGCAKCAGLSGRATYEAASNSRMRSNCS